jgi:Winged helix-turn helix
VIKQRFGVELAKRSVGTLLRRLGFRRLSARPRRVQKRAEDQALGRSRGCLSTKIHLALRGIDSPVRFPLTAGQKGDAPQAEALLGQDRPEVVMADAAYDADHFRAAIAQAGRPP